MRLNLLGPMELRGPSGPVPLGPPKQRAVLSILAMHADRVVAVDTLIDRLWGETVPANPLAGLQAYVSNLRRVLEPHRKGRAEVLVSAADGYGLMTTTLELDVREMEAHLHRAREHASRAPRLAVEQYDAALSLWRGETHADVRGEEWAQPEIARLEELRLTATEERAAAHLDIGRTLDVVTSMEALTAAHPLRERGWELLALAYVHAGRQADALAALRRVRGLLLDELGLDPGPRLRDLEAAVLRQEVTPPVRPPTSVRRAPDRPFVGRASELDRLAEAASDSMDAGVVVLVDGEPGVGKSRLVEQFSRASPTPSYLGRSPDHETASALWPWEQLLARLAADRPDLRVPEQLRDLLDRRTLAAPPYDVTGARLRLYADVATYLAAAAPLTVVLDDLHAADQASLALLEHLADERPAGVLVLATFRRHESAGLTGTLAALARSGARRLPVDGLTSTEVRSLVAAVSGDDPGAEQAETLRSRTAGNPFFLTELARAGGPVPSSVRDVVLDRVAALGDLTRVVLEAAAVVGDQAEPWLVAEVAGRPLAEVVDAMDAAERAGLVQPADQGPGVRFTHALVVDALLAGRSASWRAAAHERCARALTRTRGHLEPHHGDTARHWLAAAELGPEQAASAAEFCSRAARSAMARNAPEDALAFWQEAAAAHAIAGSATEDVFEARLGRAAALYSAGRFDDGYPAAVEALAVSDDPERVVRAADVCMAHGIWLPFQQGTDPAELRMALEKALTALPRTSPAWALGQACRGVVLACSGQEPLVDEVSAEAVAVAETLGDAALLRRAVHLRLVAMRGPDFVAQRAEAAARLRSLPELPPALAVIAELHLACHQLEVGRVDEARRALPAIETGAAETRNPTLVRQVLSMRVGLAMFDGQYDEAVALLDAADVTATGSDSSYFRAAEVGQRALMLFEQDALGEFVPALEVVLELSGLSGFGYALGIGVLRHGDRARAEELLRLPLPPRDYTWVTAVMTRLHLAVRLGDLGAVAECRDLMRPFSGQLLVSGTGTSIDGAWDSHVGEASLALGDVESARAELSAAVALLETAGSPYWLGRARQALAKCS